MEVKVQLSISLDEETLIILRKLLLEDNNTQTQSVEEETIEPSPSDPLFEMSEDEKFKVIKKEVSQYARKGKSGDVKFILSLFGAELVTGLAPKYYSAFYRSITRYINGETIRVKGKSYKKNKISQQ